MALKMATVVARGSMGSAHRAEGRTVLAAFKSMGLPGLRELHGYIWLDTYPCRCYSHSSPLLALPLAMMLPDIWCDIFTNGQDASKANCFGLFGASLV